MTTPVPARQFVFTLYLRSWLNIALWPFVAQSGHEHRADRRPLSRGKGDIG